MTSETLLLYLHGGGFVVGSLESHHAICAEIADFAGAELVAVDYRLAQNVLLAGADRRWLRCAFRACLERPQGSFSSATVPAAISQQGLPCVQSRQGFPTSPVRFLIYPALGGDLTAGSYVEMSEAPGLTTADVAYYREILQAPQDDPVAAPLKSRLWLVDCLQPLSPARSSTPAGRL